jgi:hypothetical protein
MQGEGKQSHTPDCSPPCWPLSLALSLHRHFLQLVIITIVVVILGISMVQRYRGNDDGGKEERMFHQTVEMACRA